VIIMTATSLLHSSSRLTRRRAAATLLLVLAAGAPLVSRAGAELPNKTDSLKLAVIGDNGTGDTAQYQVAAQMVAARARFPFEIVLMLGDNIYGGQSPADLVQKFERPYEPLLSSGVRFYAALGNHDDQAHRFYKPWNMGGERYYTYVSRNVRFIVLDTDFLDPAQLQWLKTTLKAATEEWKICYFHHPLYSDAGRHGSAVDLRVVLEPILVESGVQVVLSGHDHIYERIKPQKGIAYFVAGSGGQLRKGDLKRSELTAAAFDQDQAFLLMEVNGQELTFEAISRTGAVVDSGVIHR
jgi:hypothetical protein